MRTFASAFTLPSGGNWWNNSATLATKSKWNTKLTSPGVIVDAKNEAHIQELLSEGGIKLNFSARNEMFSTLIPGNSINNSNVDLQNINTSLGQQVHPFENALRFNDAAIATFNRYKFVFTKQLEDIFDKSLKIANGDKETGTAEEIQSDLNNDNINKYAVAETISSQHVPSLFNPYLAVDVIGISHNIPIYNNVQNFNTWTSYVTVNNPENFISGKQENQNQPTINEWQTDITSNANTDFTDCSIKTLVTLSTQYDPKKKAAKELGQERFKYADFMFCKDVGRISNNYLITLRRFSHPIGDDITCSHPNTAVSPDIGRMLCYIGEDNKLEDILKYQYNTSWKELNSKIQEQSSQEDSPDRGIIGSIVNLANPSYIRGVAKGISGSGNQILGWFSNQSVLGKVFSNKGTYENSEILGNYDNNKVYTPKDTVQDTHVYEGKLKFQQEFTLTFNYEMRAYDNINPRTAFLDLLANIHVVTYRTGSFWGGQQKIKGVSGNAGGWKKANAFIDKAWDVIGGFCEGLLTGNIDWETVWGSISSTFGKASQAATDFVNRAVMGNPGKSKAGATATEIGKRATKEWKARGYGDAFKGMLKNKLGRPAMYAFDSLLSGAPVGFHHVTIGNPRAPIMSIGNLIITNTTVQHYGPLGIDDFPTGLKVTVTLKHAKSRDAMDIQHMYTGGKGALASGFHGIKKIEEYYDFGALKTDTTKIYSVTNGSDSLQMKCDENGNWSLYETKADGTELKPEKLGALSNPAQTFENTITNKNSAIIKNNEKNKENENFTPAQTWGDGDIVTTRKYGEINQSEHIGVVNIFGTNNVDQIVANAAIFSRKT